MNPYSVRTMIRDPNAFVGRAAELHDLYTLLASSQSCSIVGPRRIGKSSLLYHLTHPSIYERYFSQPEAFVIAFADLQELAGLGADDFFYMAVERLNRAGRGRLQADPERDGTMSAFRRFLARATDAGLRLVLCCDEFEMLSQNPRFNADFFAYLRGLCSNYNLALVTSSRASLYDLCHQGNLQTSQFWNIFVERALGLMPFEEAEALVIEPFQRAGLSVTGEDTHFIIDLAGTHPLFVQIASYHLFEARGNLVDSSVVTGRFFDESQPHFNYAWNQLGEIEKSALSALAFGQIRQIEPTLFHRLKREALLAGNPDSPSLISQGWQLFVESQNGSSERTIPPIPRSRAILDSEQTDVQPVPRMSGSDQLVLPQTFEPYQIGRYRVDAVLGRGGMATVFRGHDPMFKRDVAIKVLPPQWLQNATYRARFEREGQIIAGLEHPAIVPVYDTGETDSQPYFVMRLMTNGSLADWLKRGAMPLEEIARVIARVASALDEAHAQGVVHRDLKPGNILFDQYGNAFLSDFGIARLAQSDAALTGTGLMGTPAYMSPEQVYGDRDIDGRSDIYSLGVILFEMLTGRVPFDADTPFKLMLKHVNEPVPDLLSFNPALTPELKAVCACALAKDPVERFPTGGDMATALAAVVRG